MTTSRRQLLIQLVVAGLLVAAFSFSLVQRLQERVEQARQTTDQTFASVLFIGPRFATSLPAIEVTVNGDAYALPPQYVRVAESGDRSGFIVLARWPEMEGMTAQTEQEFTRSSLGRIISISLHSSGDRTAPQSVAAWVAILEGSSVGPTDEHTTTFGLREFRAVGMRDGYADDIGRKDYFYPVQELDVPVHIHCTSPLGMLPSRHARQICAETTIIGNARATISYERTLLPHWREIHERARELLLGFRDLQTHTE